ncbi:MAG TPA: T9SS type A sorting domain-containing protein [Rhodothermales bacterium]|nr:T9SS type A sorting domain-containing protein [Rhodothermales bacterium]
MGPFVPGPLDAAGSAPVDCARYDRIWIVSIEDVRRYEQTGVASVDLAGWPVDLGAPIVDGDGLANNYNLVGGDRPDILGHQTAFWIVNDMGSRFQSRNTSLPIGLEIRITAHAFRSSNPALNYTTVYRYRLRKKTALPLTAAWFGFYSDTALGGASNDQIGTDTTLRMAFVYKRDDFDGGPEGYGTAPPALGYLFLDGPLVRDTNRDGMPDAAGITRAFSEWQDYRDIRSSRHYYGLMQGTRPNGQPFRSCWNGGTMVQQHTPDPVCQPTLFSFPGDPVTRAFWSELQPYPGRYDLFSIGDRRHHFTTGPFTLQPGEEQAFTMAILWARGKDHLDSITELRRTAREVQAIYDATGFRNLPVRPDPPAPTQAPQPVGPADAIEGQPARPLVSWEPVPGATFYQVAYRPLEAGDAATDTLDVQGLHGHLPLEVPGRYVWRVRAVTDGGGGPWSEPFSFTIGLPTLLGSGVFENFLTVRNAAGPLEPPEYGAIDVNHRGFPRVRGTSAGEVPTAGRMQATNSSVWGLHTADTDASDGGFDYFVSRTTRDGTNAALIGSSDYEWRFTGTSLAWNAFTEGQAYEVPFELWDIGTLPDASDDVRLVPWINPITGGQNTVFDIGADHPTSGGTNDPQTDWVYWMRPRDATPGQAGYDFVVSEMRRLGRDYNMEGIAGEVFARLVLVNWNGGAAPNGPFNGALPEPGTVFRIVTRNGPAVVLSAPRDGVTSPTPNVRLAWQEPDARVTRRYVEIATDNDFRNVVRQDSSATEPYLILSPLPGGVRYYWRVRLRVSASPAIISSGVLTPWSNAASFSTPLGSGAEEAEAPPAVLTLRAVYPSPARAGTVTVRFGTPEAGRVRLRVFDVLGREALRMFEGEQAAGWHAASINAGLLAPGLYVVRVEAGGRAVTRTLVVTR